MSEDDDAPPSVDLRFGDCLTMLRQLPDESVHVIITDPPYGLSEHKPERIAAALVAWTSGDRDHVPAGSGGFMGRNWDAFVPPPAVWDECLRVLKPGGHLAAFAGSRTYDLMGMSIRLAGFEIRDGLQWLYGSGMPKGQNVGKAIDKAAGAEREVVGEGPYAARRPRGIQQGTTFADDAYEWGGGHALTAPATPEAARWEGWNTSLKPSQEPIVLARKPIRGTVAANVLEWGCGAINIDATRVGSNGGGLQGGGREANPRRCRVHGLRDVRQADAEAPIGDRSGEASADMLEQVQGRATAGREEPELAGRGLDGREERVPQAGSGTPGTGGSGTHSGATTAGGLRAPTGDGPQGRAPSPADGDGASHQRGEGRQPSGELAPDGLGGALPGAPTDRARADDAAPAEHDPGDCTCRTDAVSGVAPSGRWPANVLLTHAPECHEPGECAPGCPVAELDRQSGTLKSGSRKAGEYGLMGYMGADVAPMPEVKGDNGSASRFFPSFRYQAKAPASERPKIDGKGWPTVKPQGLMRWLVRLLTPPGGVVLDPFAGTAATLQAARDEGFASIGIERDEFAYLLSCRRLGLPELVPATVTDADTGEPVTLVDVAEPEPVAQLPEPVDPVLAAIEAASSYDELLALWREHRWDKGSTYNEAATARRAQLEEAA